MGKLVTRETAELNDLAFNVPFFYFVSAYKHNGCRKDWFVSDLILEIHLPQIFLPDKTSPAKPSVFVSVHFFI